MKSLGLTKEETKLIFLQWQDRLHRRAKRICRQVVEIHGFSKVGSSPKRVFMELDKLILEVRWKHRGLSKSRDTAEAEQAGRLVLLGIKIFPRLLGSGLHWGRNGQADQWNRTKNQASTVWLMTEVALQRTGKEGPLSKWCRDNRSSLWRLVGFLPYTTHKICPRG